jgi:RNA polymerase sigma-70 factor, ECF subfamily
MNDFLANLHPRQPREGGHDLCARRHTRPIVSRYNPVKKVKSKPLECWTMEPVTEALLDSLKNRRASTDQLFGMLYEDFHRVAAKYLQNEPLRQKLSPTSLVHEAYVRMIDQDRVDWKGKTHFFAVGARVMRRILVDHARKVGAQKRGGAWKQVDTDHDITFELERDNDVLVLDELLHGLEALDPQQAKIVEMRFFGGMTMTEIADALGMGLRTCEKEWAMARAWLRQAMTEDRDA